MKNNRFIEFPFRDKEFFKFITLKSIAFLIDFAVIMMVVVAEYLATGQVDLLTINIYLYIMLWGISYHAIMIVSFKGTLGILLTKLKIVHKSGFLLTNLQLFSRAFMNSLYVIPFVGLAAAFANMVMVFIFNGFTIVDFFSQTILVSKGTYLELKKEEDNFLENEIKEIHKDMDTKNKKGEK